MGAGRAVFRAMVALAVVASATGCDLESGGCQDDTDCKGDRICASGVCVSPGGGDGDGDSDSDSDSDGDADGDPNECTEMERWRGIHGPEVEIPAECEVDTLSGSYVGEIPPWDDWRDAAGRNEVWAEIDGTTLLELDGFACEPVFPGYITAATAFGSDEYECEQYYLCGCCIVEFKRQPLGLPGEEVRNDIWQVYPQFPGCEIGLKQAQYIFNVDFEDAPPVTDPGGGEGGACSDCLSTCSGLDSCCTGTGCICEDACRPSNDCPEGSRYCCGPDGFCFCTDACPY